VYHAGKAKPVLAPAAWRVYGPHATPTVRRAPLRFVGAAARVVARPWKAGAATP